MKATVIKIAGVDLELLGAGGDSATRERVVLFPHSGHGYYPWQPWAAGFASCAG